MSTMTIATEIVVGDQIRFEHNEAWWTVGARDERFIVATKRATFSKKSDNAFWYTIIDLTGWAEKRYNGAGEGPVRSSLNTLGGGWDLNPDNLAESCEEILEAVKGERWELSHRRITDARRIERKAA
jgi:hypothetical protein